MRACVWRLSAIWCRRYLFFLLIDRYIVFVERRLTSRKAERFIVTRQFSPSALNCSLSSDFYLFLFFFFFHLWRTKQEGEYVLEKQVNGQGVSPYDPSHNSTAVLVGKPNLWFVISQWTDEIRDISFFFFILSRRGCGRMCAISIDDPSLILWDFSREMSIDLGCRNTKSNRSIFSLSCWFVFVFLFDCLFVYIRWWIVCRYGGRFLRNGSAHLPGTATYRTVRRYQPQR